MSVQQTDAIQARVLELLGRKIGTGRPITLESSVVSDTGLDSVSVMDFVMELEDEFDITIPLDQLTEVRTVRDLADTVQSVANGHAATYRRANGGG